MQIKSLDELQDLEVAKFDGNKVRRDLSSEYPIWRFDGCKENKLLQDFFTGEGFIQIKRWSYVGVVEEYTADTYPLDNSGMLRRKCWGDDCPKAFSSITGMSPEGVYVMVGSVRRGESVETLITWSELKDDWEWLEINGTLKLCGVDE